MRAAVARVSRMLLSLLALGLIPNGAVAAPHFQRRRGNANSARTFRMLSYAEIYAEMRRLEATYPQFVELYSAQDEFGVPSPGSCGTSGDCEQLYMRITDERTLPEMDRPEVFFSGCLHGNERVGPTTTIELARFLLETVTSGSPRREDDAKPN